MNFMITLKLSGNATRMNVASPMIDVLQRSQKQSKSYIDSNLNPVRANVIDLTKDNFTQPQSTKKILDELEISKDDYYKDLSISKAES